MNAVIEPVKQKYPEVDYSDVINNIKLQRFIAQQLLIVLQAQKDADDEDEDLTMLLLL